MYECVFNSFFKYLFEYKETIEVILSTLSATTKTESEKKIENTKMQ